MQDDYLGLRRVTCLWMSHVFIEAQKQDGADSCREMLGAKDKSKSKSDMT